MAPAVVSLLMGDVGASVRSATLGGFRVALGLTVTSGGAVGMGGFRDDWPFLIRGLVAIALLYALTVLLQWLAES